MSPAALTFCFFLVAGVVGQIFLSSSLWFLPAHLTIDHPSSGLRVFFRIMAILMCQFWSFVITTVIIGMLPVQEDLVKQSELTKTIIFVLLLPLPLMAVFYYLYAKLVRRAARQENTG